MKQRDQVAMAAGEIAAFLAGHRKLQLATINRDGTPHLVAMYYVMLGGRIAFWTYRTSQKARNLARDPRVTCLVETGEEYFDLCGVQVNGIAQRVEDPAGVLEIGRGVAGGLAGVPADAVADYVAHAARKRDGFIVEPRRTISWDHRKLAPAPAPGD
ncbi:MAG TPA: pyridoxamine 5'-phosphate oxidase family protein [Streptosporangiaceae bacterium]|jgi:PPOX class probable F420-dependent enzyme|nr:pyridoxamine 5'-phosphate oxidase family protein [Streptosporangiaceae bacterium]